MKHIRNFDSFLNETENVNGKEMTVYFHECEHEGDLNNYITDLREAGASILSSSCNSDAESGVVRIGVKDLASFLSKFKETDSYEFSSLDR